MSRAMMILLLVACGGGEPDKEGPGPDPTDTDTTDTDTTDTTDTDTTDTDTTDTDATGTETTDTAGDPGEVVLAPSTGPKTGGPSLLTGVLVTCSSAQEATLRAELIGAVGVVEATPIVDGALGTAATLTVTEGSLFHNGDGTLAVDDCEATGWRFVASVNGVETCLVTGAGAADWLADSGADCELR